MEEKETGITKMAIDYYFLQDVRGRQVARLCRAAS
jgi:hypothetical protein